MAKKSPYKHVTNTPTPFIIFGAVAGMALVTGLHWMTQTFPTLNNIPVYLAFVSILSASGWYSWFQSRYYLTKPVSSDDLIDPDKLNDGQVCYVNGEFEAKYMGKNTYKGTFYFSIEGVNNPNDETDVEELLPGEVMDYISATKVN